jgi:FlaA1/EpsC-like NDP-sugar epimerase
MSVRELPVGVNRPRTHLVIGGTGTVGSAIVSRLLAANTGDLVRVLSRDDSKQFELWDGMGRDARLRMLLGDVRDRERLTRAFEGVDTVFHAAGLKHVTGCEYNPFEAVKTNVVGTQNVIDAAIASNVRRVVFTSTDKAANPSSTMGASKLLGERLMTAARLHKGPARTVFASVRFGNVVGSRGSVVPAFARQIREGGPIRISDPDVTRYIITCEEAIDLVFEAADRATGGEVFVLKMPAVRLGDLATLMTELLAPRYGHRVEDIPIEITGAASGEKPFEELLTPEEALRAVDVGRMIAILPTREERDALAGTPGVEAQISDEVEVLPREEIATYLGAVLREAA